jgi:hypothetical protein
MSVEQVSITNGVLHEPTEKILVYMRSRGITERQFTWATQLLVRFWKYINSPDVHTRMNGKINPNKWPDSLKDQHTYNKPALIAHHDAGTALTNACNLPNNMGFETNLESTRRPKKSLWKTESRCATSGL